MVCGFTFSLGVNLFGVNEMFDMIGLFEQHSGNEYFDGCNYFKWCNEDNKNERDTTITRQKNRSYSRKITYGFWEMGEVLNMDIMFYGLINIILVYILFKSPWC